MSLNFWKGASTKRKRIYSIIAIFALALIVTVLGMLVPLSPQQAKTIYDDVNSTLQSSQANGTLASYIFGNNLMICLIMFIPIAGPIVGFTIIFSSGTALSAIAIAQGYPPYLALIAEFVTPVFWLEFVAYSTAIAGSIWLLRRMLQHKGKYEIRNTCILIAICAVILLVTAHIETTIIGLA